MATSSADVILLAVGTSDVLVVWLVHPSYVLSHLIVHKDLLNTWMHPFAVNIFLLKVTACFI